MRRKLTQSREREVCHFPPTPTVVNNGLDSWTCHFGRKLYVFFEQRNPSQLNSYRAGLWGSSPQHLTAVCLWRVPTDLGRMRVEAHYNYLPFLANDTSCHVTVGRGVGSDVMSRRHAVHEITRPRKFRQWMRYWLYLISRWIMRVESAVYKGPRPVLETPWKMLTWRKKWIKILFFGV